MISDGSFPKKEHLLTSKDFRAAYKSGRSVRRGGFVLYSLPNTLGHDRIGFSISSSVIKRANLRNRIRRLVREAYRRNKARMKCGNDLVLVVRRSPGKKVSYGWAEALFLSMIKDCGAAT